MPSMVGFKHDRNIAVVLRAAKIKAARKAMANYLRVPHAKNNQDPTDSWFPDAWTKRGTHFTFSVLRAQADFVSLYTPFTTVVISSFMAHFSDRAPVQGFEQAKGGRCRSETKIANPYVV
ncbi:hypothetical protein PoB_003600000 [Plakobranchus ocellatus]|uniref:Uncharacterized protein n=1 Tax=Plakobranchus ocellatus TaxID=259542 RepID=A0AAV4ARK1_9GAST|nr:hypothetical protein PoB_003600000 [Plakobranchus ocellatus]